LSWITWSHICLLVVKIIKTCISCQNNGLNFWTFTFLKVFSYTISIRKIYFVKIQREIYMLKYSKIPNITEFFVCNLKYIITFFSVRGDNYTIFFILMKFLREVIIWSFGRTHLFTLWNTRWHFIKIFCYYFLFCVYLCYIFLVFFYVQTWIVNC